MSKSERDLATVAPAWRIGAKRLVGKCVLALVLATAGCTDGGGSLADNGGISGTGISQGPIDAFGSIFVNGVRWDLSSATIEIGGAAATESDLRVGMFVRVEGDFDATATGGGANRVVFEAELEGPIEAAPVETVLGLEKTFTILGQSVTVDAAETIFDDGAAFVTLAQDDVLEVSGFPDGAGGIAATRVALRGTFPIQDEVERIGDVVNPVVNPDDSGLFDLGALTVRFTATTVFDDVTRATLMAGDRVRVEGTLRPSGTEIDAVEVELEPEGIAASDLARIEIEGVATACPESPDFCVAGVPVDISSATFEPIGFMPMVGDRVEVEGPLVGGTLVAEEVEDEDADALSEDARIEAAVTSVNAVARTLVVLGVTVRADGETTLEDDSVIQDESFEFGEIQVGDFLRVEGVAEGTSTVRALSIRREDAMAGSDDVRLEGPVTALDRLAPALEILGQAVPTGPGTLYFDVGGVPRTQTEFFSAPGDVDLGDVVRAEDESAASLSTLSESDEIEIEEAI